MHLTIFLLIIINIHFLGYNSMGAENEWNGLIPLQSNRQDVEKLLGTSTGNNTYKSKNGTVLVSYATGRCKGEPNGWNVSADTVLSFSIEPSDSQSLDSLRLDEIKFVKTFGHAGYTYYTNANKGIQYTVYQDGHVSSVRYIPTEADGILRCEGFPSYDPVTETYAPFQKYSKKDWKFGAAVIDNVIIESQNSPNTKIYVFIYADENMSRKDYSGYIQKLEKHLSKEKESSKQIFINKGGYRNNFEVEIFLLPEQSPVPKATPTLAEKTRKSKD